MFRKLLIQILCIIFAFSSIAVAAPITSEVETYNLYAYNTMSALSVIDSQLEPEQIVTREVFAGVVAKMMGFDTQKKAEKTYFYDVETDGDYTACINYLVDKNIISGYTGSVFMPGKSISVEEMITVLVTIAGYKDLALIEGGYPKGYIKQLDRMNIRLSVPTTQKEACVAQMAELVYEFFNAQVLGFDGVYADGSVGLNSEKTLSEVYLGIKQYKGVLTATEQTAIYEDTYLGEGYVQIDDNVYSTEDDYCDLIGYYVEYYADEDKNLYYMVSAPKKNETAKLMSKYIKSSFVNRIITYKTDFGQNKTYNISDVCSFIYNGKFDVFDFNKLIGHDGDITLVDNDKDGIYDVVFCDKYDVYVVGEVTDTRKIIVDKFNKNKKIDLDDDKIHRLIIRDSEKEISLSDIKKGDVLFCLKSTTDNIYCKIIRTNELVSGKVDSVSDEYIEIDGEKFYVSQYFLSAQNDKYMPVCDVGSYGTFALTPYGEIAYYISDGVQTELSYGYLYKTFENPDSANGITFSIMSQTGEWIRADAAEKLTVNRMRQNLYDVMYDANFNTQQLIKYRQNEKGEISVINFTQFREENSVYDVSEGLFRSRYLLAENREYKNTDKYFVKGGAIDFFINDNTIVFVVPQDKTNVNRDEDYYIAGVSYFKSGNSYKIQPFDETEYNVPSVVVVEEPANAAMHKKSTSTSFVVVDKIKKMLIDDEVCDVLAGYKNGAEEEFIIARESGIFVREDGTELQRGDLIIANSDYFGKVNRITIVKLKDKEPLKLVEGAHSEEFQYIYGKVVRIGDGYITIKNSSNTFRMVCNNPTVTVYNSKWNEVGSGDVNEICAGDEVVVRNSVSRVKEIVLYE